MARDSSVGRERSLIVPGNIPLDSTTIATIHAPITDDINQQILEVSQKKLFLIRLKKKYLYIFIFLYI